MYILNGLQDQTLLYLWAKILKTPLFLSTMQGCGVYQQILGGQLHPALTNQPLMWVPFLGLFGLFGYGFLLVYPLFVSLLNFLVAIFLLKDYKYKYIYSLLLTFSSYFWIKIGIHQELINVWLITLCTLFLVKIFYDRKSPSKLNYLLAGCSLLVATLVSNYYGFMLGILTVLFIFSALLTDRKNIKRSVVGTLITLVVSSAVAGMILFPYIRASYWQKTNSQSSDFGATATFSANRPYEDFFTFSLRPWYFLTPSPKNPIYADFSKSITEKIASTGYFLADDYFPAEHSGAFYGYLLLATFFVLLYFGLFKSSKELRPKIWTLFLTIVMVLSVTMPPFFTIAGVEIYTPGWLVYKFFPMFRVTARFTVVILLLMLMIMAEVITENYEKWKKFLKYFMPVLLIVTLVETFVPFKIEKYDVAPTAYNYMSSQVPMSMNFVVYPYDESNEALFWLPTHKQCLMNVRDNNYPDISSADLTKKIFLSEGLEKAKKHGIEYVLVFGGDSNYAKFSDPSFVLNEDFGDSRLYKIQ